MKVVQSPVEVIDEVRALPQGAVEPSLHVSDTSNLAALQWAVEKFGPIVSFDEAKADSERSLGLSAGEYDVDELPTPNKTILDGDEQLAGQRAQDLSIDLTSAVRRVRRGGYSLSDVVIRGREDVLVVLGSLERATKTHQENLDAGAERYFQAAAGYMLAHMSVYDGSEKPEYLL